MRALSLMNSPRDVAESGARWLCESTAEQIAVEFRLSRRSLLAVDGFMGSGKTTLSKLLAAQLGCYRLSLDETLPDEPTGDPSLSYIERLDQKRIAAVIAEFRDAGEGIVEGVCLRSTLARHGIAPSDVFHVYAASVVVHAGEGNLLWNDATFLDLLEFPEESLYREIAVYHGEWHPHAGADAIVMRSDDEEVHDFIAPNGQRFSIRAALWKAAGIGLWLPPAGRYVSANPGASIETLAAIRPPILSAETRGLDDGRMVDILTKIRRETPLDPVKVYREPDSGAIVLADGAHRYFASAALCCQTIPCEYIELPQL